MIGATEEPMTLDDLIDALGEPSMDDWKRGLSKRAENPIEVRIVARSMTRSFTDQGQLKKVRAQFQVLGMDPLLWNLVQDAAMAIMAKDHISRKEFAVLYGPWSYVLV